jgi:hypothetical protein
MSKDDPAPSERAVRIMAAFDALPRHLRDKINAEIMLSDAEKKRPDFMRYCFAHFNQVLS